MKIFYHGSDMDGKCSGAIARKFYQGEGEYIPYFYGDFPYESIRNDEVVILVDCSCDFEILMKITKKIIWIDHHKTAIDKYEHLKLRGMRVDGTAACKLCWLYYFDGGFKDKNGNIIIGIIPSVVDFLADYDVWKFAFGDDTNYLQTGIRLYDTSIESEMWDKWLDYNYYPIEELDKGKIALQYRNDYYRSIVKTASFFTSFKGYKAVCCNASCVSSQLFDSIEEEYDIMIPFHYDGSQWKYSLYTKKDNIDCGKIALHFGGGGHKKAAGFKFDELLLKV